MLTIMQCPATLNGKTIIVTRPLLQAQNILQQLESLQATTIHFPVISIQAIKNTNSAENIFRNLDQYYMVIFISANAVHYAVTFANESGIPLKPRKIAAVGPATHAALQNYGYHVDVVPRTGFNSEALLKDPALTQVNGQKILIVRGQGGREWLRKTLESHQAQVDYAEVYQRQLPQHRNPTDLSQLPPLDSAVLIYSAESAQNLWSLCSQDEQLWLTKVTFILGSERIAEACTRAGYTNNSIIAKNPSDQEMLNALVGWAD